MSLTSQLVKLNDEQMHELHNALLEACAAMELGGNWREIFRRARHRHIGLMSRIYKLLYNATRDEIDRAARHLIEHIEA